jgi:predicted acyl esterase
LYSEERIKDINRFFDYYLKGSQNGWLSTPKVRCSILNHPRPALLNLTFADLPWNLPSAQSQKLYLGANKTLSNTPVTGSEILKYAADSTDDDGLTFQHTFK